MEEHVGGVGMQGILNRIWVEEYLVLIEGHVKVQGDRRITLKWNLWR
jgi:hypothetical protein